MDPFMGLVGAVVITHWSYVLLIDISRILLDREAAPVLVAKIRTTIEADSDNLVADLDVWQVSPHDLAVIFTVVTHFPQPPDHYKALLRDFIGNAHLTVEVQKCESEPCPVKQ
jgi:Co/Zn/Cd efflux system component